VRAQTSQTVLRVGHAGGFAYSIRTARTSHSQSVLEKLVSGQDDDPCPRPTEGKKRSFFNGNVRSPDISFLGSSVRTDGKVIFKLSGSDCHDRTDRCTRPRALIQTGFSHIAITRIADRPVNTHRTNAFSRTATRGGGRPAYGSLKTKRKRKTTGTIAEHGGRKYTRVKQYRRTRRRRGGRDENRTNRRGDAKGGVRRARTR